MAIKSYKEINADVNRSLNFLPDTFYKANSSGNVPHTQVRTDHAISILVNGSTIGMIQEWTPQQARNVTPLYEINAAGQGNVLENSPGVSTGLTINIVRFDLFTARMEQIWGSGFDITMLTEQSTPITINERWQQPNGRVEIWTYTGCWFTSLGRTHSATGDRITKVNASLMYVKKYKVSEFDTFAGEVAGAIVEKIF